MSIFKFKELDLLDVEKAKQATLDGFREISLLFSELDNAANSNIFADPRDFGAKVNGVSDDTQAFNDALATEKSVYLPEGIANIEGTIAVTEGNSLTLASEVTLQRFSGNSIEPLVHLYGSNALFDAKGAKIRHNLYDHPHGIILVGQHPNSTSGSVTDVSTRNAMVYRAKVIGPENTVNELETGSPGIYVHSNGRKLGAFSNIHTFKCQFFGNEIVNCDVLMEFSSDANAHYINWLYCHQWIKAAIFFNGSYGNVFNGLNMEAALENIVPSAAKRYAVHFDAQNDGVETGTDATYTFDAGSQNIINGFAELTNGGNTNISLFTFEEPGTVFGANSLNITGVLSGGIGKGGLSNDASIGSNNVSVAAIKIVNSGQFRIKGHSFRTLDDGSGTYEFRDSTAIMTKRAASVPASTQKDLFSIDNIGTTQAGMLIEVSYAGKASTIQTVKGGKIAWIARILNTATFNSKKIYDFGHSFASSHPFTFNITLTAGTGTNTMKATVGFLTSATVGNRFVGWTVTITSTNVEGSGLDWDKDLHYF